MNRAEGSTALRAGDLIGPAARGLRAAFPRVWPVLLGLAVVTTAISLFMNGALEGAKAAADPRMQTAWVTLGAMLVMTMVGAAAAIPLFRTLVGRGETAYRLDGNAVRYLAVQAGIAGVVALWMLPTLLMPDPKAATPEQVATFGGLALVLLISAPAMIWAGIRITLWPLGLLVGERGLTLREAWARMHGASWAYVAALVAMVGPPVIMATLVSGADGLGAVREALSAAFSAVGSLAANAVGAELYRRRVGAQGVEGVFD